MQEDLLCSPYYKQQAMASINAFTTSICNKMDQLKAAFKAGMINDDQLRLGRSKLLKEAEQVLHVSIQNPADVLLHLENSSLSQQKDLTTFSVIEFIKAP